MPLLKKMPLEKLKNWGNVRAGCLKIECAERAALKPKFFK